jgi:altronate hydrolase
VKTGLIITKSDNVATLLDDVAAGEAVLCRGLDAPLETMAREAVGRGHKIALSDIPAGSDIVKYGFAIGQATAGIAAGSHVHVHNVRSRTTEE